MDSFLKMILGIKYWNNDQYITLANHLQLLSDPWDVSCWNASLEAA